MIDNLSEMAVALLDHMRNNELTLFGPRNLGSDFIFMKNEVADSDSTIEPGVVRELLRFELLEEIDSPARGNATLNLQYRLTDLAKKLDLPKKAKSFGFYPPR